MINSSLKEKYWDSSTDKQMVISVVGTNQKIDNSMLEIGTFALEESLCSESELKFGACEANCVKFTARNTAGNIIGKTISIEETIDGDRENPMPYGVFKVASDVPTADRTKRQITAYDAMYDIINADVKSWYAGLSFPMTLKQFRNSFFAHLGIAQVETSLVNDSMTVNKTIVATQTDDSSAVTEESAISGKTVVTAICEINGCFGNINREGKFEYVFLKEIISALYPAEDLFPSDNVFPSDANTESMTGHYITFDYEDFQSRAISHLEIRSSDDSAGVTVGTSGNNYVISGNFLVSDKTGAELETIAENTLSVIKKAAYIPIKSSEIVGNPCIELGDPIRFNTTREIIESYVLHRTLTGIQSKRDSITSLGTETHSAKVNSIKDTISNLSGRTNKLERTADHTLSEIKAVDSKVNELDSSVHESVSELNSKIEQTAEQIQTEVTRATGVESILSSNITQNAESIQSEVINRQNADNEMSTKISQTAHSVALVATGGDNSVGIEIQLYDENGKLIDTKSDTANITITGFVSFADLAGKGTTTIDGANIKTGYISADRISGGTLMSETYLLLGHRPEYSDIENDYDWTHYYFSFYRINEISDEPVLFVSAPSTICGIDIRYDDSADGRRTIRLGGCHYMDPHISQECMGLTTVNTDYIDVQSVLMSGGNYFGVNFSTRIYGTHIETPYINQTSDRNMKTDIKPIELKFDSFIDGLMELVSTYYLIGAENSGHKIGFIAQDVEDLIRTCGLTHDDIGIVSKIPIKDEFGNTTGHTYSLGYNDFIGLLFRKCKNQDEQINSLKQENLALQNRVSILESRMEELENVINNKNN